MPGPKPRGDRTATPAERSAAYRARRKVTAAAAPTKPPVVVRYRRPADRRSRPERWADAVQTLADMLDRFQEWRGQIPPRLAHRPPAGAPRTAQGGPGAVVQTHEGQPPKGLRRR